MSDQVVEFEGWELVLKETVPADLQKGFREAVIKFRYWLREMGKEANVGAFRAHLAWKKSYLPPEKYETRRQALRWYWEKGGKRPKAAISNQPLPRLRPPSIQSSIPFRRDYGKQASRCQWP